MPNKFDSPVTTRSSAKAARPNCQAPAGALWSARPTGRAPPQATGRKPSPWPRDTRIPEPSEDWGSLSVSLGRLHRHGSSVHSDRGSQGPIHSGLVRSWADSIHDLTGGLLRSSGFDSVLAESAGQFRSDAQVRESMDGKHPHGKPLARFGPQL